jgi:hypothetical protein
MIEMYVIVCFMITTYNNYRYLTISIFCLLLLLIEMYCVLGYEYHETKTIGPYPN